MQSFPLHKLRVHMQTCLKNMHNTVKYWASVLHNWKMGSCTRAVLTVSWLPQLEGASRNKDGFPQYHKNTTDSLLQRDQASPLCIAVLVAWQHVSNSVPHHNWFAERSHWSLWCAWRVNSCSQDQLFTWCPACGLRGHTVCGWQGQLTWPTGSSGLNEYLGEEQGVSRLLIELFRK